MAAPKPNEELLTTDKHVLRFYRAYETEHGEAPGYKAIATATGLSTSGARYSVIRLKEKGYLQEKKVTAIRLTLSMKGRKVEL